jgi:hypothetical protein
LEKKYKESKHRNRWHIDYFFDRGEIMHDDIRLFLLDVSLSAEIDYSNPWSVDYGASIHMCCNKDLFENYHETNNGANIYLGDGLSHQIKGYGDVYLTFPNGCVKQIQNVMYVPSINKNLISVSTISYQALKFEFVKTHCFVKYIRYHYKITTT